mmetsp:Transcript_24393/g.41437  ORF Transcript_24393/g.41437 Transcript_24393/m.41437 type:complete len:202 (-) Transcript_24393:296-901(-)
MGGPFFAKSISDHAGRSNDAIISRDNEKCDLRKEQLPLTRLQIHSAVAIAGFLLGLLGVLATYAVHDLITARLFQKQWKTHKEFLAYESTSETRFSGWCLFLTVFVAYFAFLLDVLARRTGAAGVGTFGSMAVGWVVLGCQNALALIWYLSNGSDFLRVAVWFVGSNLVWFGLMVLQYYWLEIKKSKMDEDEGEERVVNYL